MYLKNRKNIHGFTLIETLLAITIIAIILLALNLTNISSNAFQKENVLRNRAIEYLQSYTDLIRQGIQCSNNCSTEGENIKCLIHNPDYENIIFTITHKKLDNLPHGLNILTIWISYKWKGINHSYSLNTTVYR